MQIKNEVTLRNLWVFCLVVNIIKTLDPKQKHSV